jgi:hypothetical protein
MVYEILGSILVKYQDWVANILSSPLENKFATAWQIIRKVMPGFSSEGVYEVIDYESTLEIHDPKGIRATFNKQKKVRYLQDNIIAYQDYAWGDGNILLNYQTSRGRPVDRYRSGFKTYILLSLREVKNRGDIDEFNIQWNIRKGFLTEDGYWGTDISQRTKHLKVNVIFPKSRPPLHITLEETNPRRTHLLKREDQKQLPDGRWLVTLEKNNPNLYELFVLRWIW